jgi:hypothetical protein
MEKLLLPRLKGRTAERAALFREFAFAELMGQSTAIIDGKFCPISYWELDADDLEGLRNRFKDTISERFGKFRTSTYDAPGYARFATRFFQRHRKWTKRRNSEAKAANARKGWEKRRKAKKTKTGAKPKVAELKEILDPPPPGA